MEMSPFGVSLITAVNEMKMSIAGKSLAISISAQYDKFLSMRSHDKAPRISLHPNSPMNNLIPLHKIGIISQFHDMQT